MVKGFGSVRYLALSCSLLVLGCTAPNTSVSETPPPQVIRPENTHVLRDTSAPRKDTGHLQVTPLPAPYKSWEAFYDDFFSEDESVSFRTQGLVQVANYNLPSLTANMKYGGTPWKIKDIPYRFNLPQVLKETDKTNAFFQVAELGRDDNNKLFVSKVILAISLHKRQDVSEYYEVKNWMNRHFYSEDGITFEAREPTDGEKNYTLLKASYKDLTPYEKNRDYGDSTASYADLTTCNSYYRVESGTRAVNYPVNILSLSGPGAPDENGKMYATATGQVKSVFYGTASHRARFYCPVESTSDNDNSLGEISSDAYFTFNALWDPNQQISCYKTEGSTITGDKWYYDSLSEVPKIFSVNNQQCSPCQPGALRDDSMPEICRSTSPSPTPTPTASPSPTPTPTPSPTPTPENCEDSPMVSPEDMEKLINGLNSLNLQSNSFGTQSIVGLQILNNKNKSATQTSDSPNLVRQQGLEELDDYEQRFRQFVQSQPLLKSNEILNAPAPSEFDGYRQQILELIEQVRIHNDATHAELVLAANAHSKLKQTYIQLAKAHLNNVFMFDGSSTWPAFDDLDFYDADTVNVLKSIQDSAKLLNYVDQQLNQLSQQLTNTQKQLAHEIGALFNELGVTPKQFTTEYYQESQHKADAAYAQVELAMEAFKQNLNPSGFSTQAKDNDSLVQQAYDTVENALYDYLVDPTEQGLNEVAQRIKQGRDTISKHAPQYLRQWDQIASSYENYMVLAPIANINQYIRGKTLELLSCSRIDADEVIRRAIESNLDGAWSHIARRHGYSSSNSSRKGARKSDKYNTDDIKEMKALTLKALLKDNKKVEITKVNGQDRVTVYADLSPEVTGHYKGKPLTKMVVTMNTINSYIVTAHPSRK